LRILRQAGIEPEVVVSGIDEGGLGGVPAREVVARLAARKVEAVREELPEALVLACDSVVAVGDEVAGKPSSPEQARSWWRAMRGTSVTVWTGHHLLDTASGTSVGRVTSAAAHIGFPSEEEIERYLATDEPWGAAGAFRLDGRAAAFVLGVTGDPGTVHGVSVPTVRSLLAELGVSVADLWA
jgi:septum formation protein